MSILLLGSSAGNLITKLSFNLQPTLVSLPWLKRTAVRCFASNIDESGFLVRYIPKNRRDVKQTQSSTSRDSSNQDDMPDASISHSNIRGHKSPNTMDKWSKIRTRKSSTRLPSDTGIELNQESIHGKGVVDTEHVGSLEEVGEELQIGKENSQLQEHKQDQKVRFSFGAPGSKTLKHLREGVQEQQICKRGDQCHMLKFNNEINSRSGRKEADEPIDEPEEIDEMLNIDAGNLGKHGRLRASRIKQDAEKLAIEFLAKRAFTAVELRKKLIAKHFPVNIVQALIHDFQVRGLINDCLYAQTFTQSRWTSSSWGPRRIKQALFKKGVSEVDVENAVKVIFEDDEDGDCKSSLRLSNSSLEQLYMQASKQWQRGQNVPYEKRKARIISWLRYRGFDWVVVSIILRKLESHHPP